MKYFQFLFEEETGQYELRRGHWEITSTSEDIEEILVTADSISIDIIIGYGFRGRFIYFPALCLGLDLPDHTDTTRIERLIADQIGNANAVIISSAIYDYFSQK